MISLTSTSVSGRGISTRSSTARFKCLNDAEPTAYANGAPLASFRAASAARSATDRSTTAARFISGHERGTSSSAAMMSVAMRRGSAILAARSCDATSSMTLTIVGFGPEDSSFDATLLAEPVLDVGDLQCFDDRLDVSIENLSQLVHRESNAMIGDAVLRKVVSANLCRSVAGADLRLAHSRALRFLLGEACVKETGAQHFHCLELVLELRFLVLLADHNSGGNVRYAHSGIGGVDALATGARRAEHVDAKVLVFDPEVDLFSFRKHGDRGSGGVNATLVFGNGHSLHAMNAGFPAHRSEDAFSFHLEDCFLDAAQSSLGVGDHLDAPAAFFGEAAVHAEEVCGKDSRFVAAGAGTYFDDGGTIVERVVGNERGLDALLELGD